jgi:competence protein ComEC
MMHQERPFLLPFLVMVVGLVISDQAGFSLPYSSLAAAFACLVISSLIKSRPVFVICTALFFFVWGLCALSPWKSPPSSPRSITCRVAAAPVTVEGVVQSRPIISTTGSRFVVRTEQLYRVGIVEPVCGDLMLYVGEGDVTMVRGDRIRFITRITIPSLLGLPGEFDFLRYLGFQGFAATGRVASQNDIVLIRAAAVDNVLRRADLMALYLGDFIRSSHEVPLCQVDSEGALVVLICRL